jgi:glycine/D-amino acid oxidase-like deaminating enzyme
MSKSNPRAGDLPMSSRPHPLARTNPETFVAGFTEKPYWHEGVNLTVDAPAGGLPSSADVVIVGGGYTGLSAGTVTAGAGRSTIILEAETLGYGCSGINGGNVGTSIKPSLGLLGGRFGRERALAIHREGHDALEKLHELVAARALECDWQPVGRFVGAHSQRHFANLRALADVQTRELGMQPRVVERQDQRNEIGTDAYYGGLVYSRPAAVHPAKLLSELYRIAREAGVQYFARSAALSIRREGDQLVIDTARGSIKARNVLIATNGYTGAFSPWHRRRVIPIRSQIIATEPLAPEVMRAMLPTARLISDTRRVVVYYRGSPDGTRILFGGRATLSDSPPAVFAPLLLRWARAIFPQLAQARVTHAWSGSVGYTFDTLPHLGVRDGVHYCMGYCGSGVSLSTHFGRKIGLQILGRPEGRTALDDLPFATRPLYYGTPWFLAPSVLAYRMLDALKI